MFSDDSATCSTASSKLNLNQVKFFYELPLTRTFK